MKKRIVFMGGKQVGYASLLFLLQQKQSLNAEVVAVFENLGSPLSNKNYSLRTLARQYEIPHFEDKSYLSNLENIDFIFSIQYNEILSVKEIEIAKTLAVNLHMAPLPEYRGCNQFSFALIDAAKEFGTTLHVLEPGIDAGSIIFEKRFKILENEFVGNLYDRTLGFSVSLFQEKIEAILNCDFQLTPQAELVENRGTSFHLRSEMNDLKRIDDSWPLKKQKRYFRATFFPAFEPPTLVSKGEEIELSLDWYNQLK